MSGGGGNLSPMASAIAQIDAANSQGKSIGPTPGYISPSQLGQQNTGYQPTTETAPQVSPFVQQMMMQRQMPQFNPYQQSIMGLPALLMQLQMQGRLNQPMMRSPMPIYQNPALAYRPNMSGITANLNRVQPSVAEQQRLQAIEDARIAAEKAELEARRPQGISSGDSGAGG
jgi:hypothetical protein